MTPFDWDELANRVLEGTATPSQRAQLEARLASDPAARQRFDTLALAFRSLARLERAEAPAEFEHEILRAIHAEPAHRSAPVTASRPAFDGRRAFGLRVAGAFAAGVAVTAIAFTLGGGIRPLGSRAVEGTMAPPSRVEAARLDAGEATAAIEARFGAGEVLVRIEARPDRGATLEIAHPGRTVAEIHPLAASAGKVSIERDRLVIEVGAPASWTLRLAGRENQAGNSGIELTLASGSKVERRMLGAPSGDSP